MENLISTGTNSIKPAGLWDGEKVSRPNS